MAKSLKQARTRQNEQDPKPVADNKEEDEMKEAVADTPVQANEVKEDKGKLREELALIRAEIPKGMAPVSVELDSDAIIKQAWSDFKERAVVTPLTTQEMVDATQTVIQLIEDGHTWDDSEELRKAFRKVPNSFAKGPVISTGLQLLCGKVAKFDTKEVPVYRTGTKIGGRWVYQDDMGFFRTIGRFPVSLAEAASDESKTADNQGTHTFLSHSAHFEGVDFWCTEPQHQLHDHITSRGIKKPVSSGKKVDTKEDQAAALKQRLATYERLHRNASDETTKRTAAEKITFIQQKLAELEAA